MKKQLLQESEIRKMMKFANIGALSNNFIEKLDESVETGDIEEGMHAKRDDDDEMDEGMYGKRDDELDEQADPGADPMDDEEDVGAEPEEDMGDEPEMDMGGEEMPGGGDLPPEAVEELEGLVNSLKAVLSLAGEDGKALADALSVEKEGGDMDMGGEPEMDMDMGAEPDPMGGEDEPPGGDPMEEDMMLEEVARRVARRLRRLKRR